METSGPSLLDGAGIVTEGRHTGRAMETGHAVRSGSQVIGSGGGVDTLGTGTSVLPCNEVEAEAEWCRPLPDVSWEERWELITAGPSVQGCLEGTLRSGWGCCTVFRVCGCRAPTSHAPQPRSLPWLPSRLALCAGAPGRVFTPG